MKRVRARSCSAVRRNATLGRNRVNGCVDARGDRCCVAPGELFDLLPIAADELRIPPVRVFWRALEGFKVDVDQAEPFAVALMPFEVVEDRPVEVAAHVDA